MRLCSVDGCGKEHHARGLCQRCYQRQPERLEAGRVNSRRASVARRSRGMDPMSLTYAKRGFREFLEHKWFRIRCRWTGNVNARARQYYAHVRLYPLPSRSEFIEHYLHNEGLKRLWRVWVASDCERRLCPVPDRVNSNKGYTFSNIEWITLTENSRRANELRYYGRTG